MARLFKVFTITLLLCAGSAYAQQSLAPSAQQARLAKQALSHARAKDFSALARTQKQLGSSPLDAYFDYHKVRDGLPNLSPNDVKAYQRKYADNPLANSIQNVATVAYGSNQRWASLLAIQPNEPNNITAQCYYWRAQYSQNPGKALKAVPDLWLSGESRPNACDPLFDAARKAGVINNDLVWQRIELALAKQNAGLIRHLTSFINGTRAQQSEFALQVLANPQRVLALPNQWPEPFKDKLKEIAVIKESQKSTTAGLTLLRKLTTAPAAMGQQSRLAAERQLVWLSVVRRENTNLRWVDQWLAAHGDDELFAQRARFAIKEQQWDSTEKWINQLSKSEQNDPRWQYWYGRALQAQGKQGAAKREFKKAAKRRTFWAFLAADQLNMPYAINNQAAPQTQLSNRAALQRIFWLRAIEEHGLVRSEWLHWLRQHPQEAPALANYALQQNWPALTVDAAIQMKDRDTLAWRFPLAHHEDFKRAAREENMDPYLLMAIARRESAYQYHVVSHAGAVGLMQVMPATARQVANWRGEAAPSQQQLMQPLRSIQLGSTYIKRQLSRFGNNRALSLAAYNAGPHRVNAWLTPQNLPYDVWIESIPFYETREYVQAVLVYRVLLEAAAKGDTAPRGTLLTPAEKKAMYNHHLLR